MDLLSRIDALIAQRTQEDRGPPLSDEERAKELVRIVAMWGSNKEVRARVDKLAEEPEFAELAAAIKAAGQRKAEEFRQWLAQFKREQATREAARAPLSAPSEADMAPAEESPGKPPTDARHYKSWLSKVEKWFSTRPEQPAMPEIKSPAEMRAEREAQAAQRRRQDAQIREIQSANERAVRARFGPSFSWLG